MAQDLLTLLAGHHIKKREELPKPGKLRGRNVRGVMLPALAAAKVELYREMKSAGVRKADLARRLNQPKQRISGCST